MKEIDYIEQHKENIEPLKGGRSVSKLASLYSTSDTYKYQKQKAQLLLEKDKFEYSIEKSQELDDPLQAFVDYIDWTHTHFPQGANVESGLVLLLERCTSCFRDVPQYKNDPRYLKVWIEYIKYSDSPRDIFIYLAKKQIGVQLAIYYEEFSHFLELEGKITDAREIYELGIQLLAFPLERLRKSFKFFNERINANTIPGVEESSRIAPSEKHGPASAAEDRANSPSEGGEYLEPKMKKSKIDIYQDTDQSSRSVLLSIFDDVGDVHLQSKLQRTKENVIPAVQWQGQILKQKEKRQIRLSDKIEIFRDEDNSEASLSESKKQLDPGFKQRVCTDRLGGNENLYYTLVEVTGKKPERVMINMDLLYPVHLEELGFSELLAITRYRQRMSKSLNCNSPKPIDKTKVAEITETFTIPLNDDHTMKIRDPTLTAVTKLAQNDVLDMFNGSPPAELTEDEDNNVVEPTVTNLEGFVTETLHPKEHVEEFYRENNGHLSVGYHNQKDGSNSQEVQVPQLHQHHQHYQHHQHHYDNYHHDNSIPTQVDSLSPQVNREIHTGASKIEGQQIIDPFSHALQDHIIEESNIPISLFPGFYDRSNKSMEFVAKQRRNSTGFLKSISRASKLSMIDCGGDELFCLIRKLGDGGYGYVYLVESASSGASKALKVENPASKWEFYILHQINKRLLKSPEHSRLFIKCEALYLFRDESFLILDYYPHGSLLDLVNLFRSQNRAVDEDLCIFLTIELIKSTNVLHEIGIIHGDLKADNCMLRLNHVDDHVWSEVYDGKGQNGWDGKGITIIDFGRAIDMTAFRNNDKNRSSNNAIENENKTSVQFVSHLITDDQDCPQMNEGRPWAFEADYYGLACIVHTLLFGSYLKVNASTSTAMRTSVTSSTIAPTSIRAGKVRPEQNFKRYWQTNLWEPLFDILLNPGTENSGNNSENKDNFQIAVAEKLRDIQVEMEIWLERNSKSHNLKSKLKSLELDLAAIHKV